MRSDSPWHGWVNAEIYRGYVDEYPIYRWLNARLVELAAVESARRVLDLACGSGATALAVLARLPRDGELVGVDASRAMVALARAQVRDPRARFHVAAAASVADTVDRAIRDAESSFDCAVCNAAFWQFPAAAPVLAGLGRLVAAGGRFVFNVPAERVSGEAAPMHGLQAALARDIEQRTGRPFPATASAIDPVRLSEELQVAGFELAAPIRRIYRGRQQELAELMEIPAMIAPLAPELPPDERRDLVRTAARRVDLDEEVEVPWIYFIAHRRAEEARDGEAPGQAGDEAPGAR